MRSPVKVTAAPRILTQHSSLHSAQLHTYAPVAPHHPPQPHRPPPPRFQPRPPATSASTGQPQTHTHVQGSAVGSGSTAWPKQQQQQQQQQLHHQFPQQLQQQHLQQQRQQQVMSSTACLSAKPVLQRFGQRPTAQQTNGGQQSMLPPMAHGNAFSHSHVHAQPSCQHLKEVAMTNAAAPAPAQLPPQLTVQLPEQFPPQLPPGWPPQQGHLQPQSLVQHPLPPPNLNVTPNSHQQGGPLPPAGNHYVVGSNQAAAAAAAAPSPAQVMHAQQQPQGGMQLQPGKPVDAARPSAAASRTPNPAEHSDQLKQQVRVSTPVCTCDTLVLAAEYQRRLLLFSVEGQVLHTLAEALSNVCVSSRCTCQDSKILHGYDNTNCKSMLCTYTSLLACEHVKMPAPSTPPNSVSNP